MATRIKASATSAVAARSAGDIGYINNGDGSAVSQAYGDWTSNLSLIAIGIAEVRHGSAIVEGGIAHIAEGIYAAWNTPIRWSYGRDDNEVSGAVNLGDMFKGRRSPKGESDTKFLPAMYRAVAECFGVDGEFSGADKMAFQRAFGIAAAKVAGSPVEFVDADITRKGEKVLVRAVQVPASVAIKLTEDGKLTDLGEKAVEAVKSHNALMGSGNISDEEALKRASALSVKCVGGKNGILGKVPSSTDIANTLRESAVLAGFMPAPKARASAARGDKMGEALDYVTKCLDLFLEGSEESDLAPCDAVEAKMRGVAERIAAYFVN
jgi:hypothetical protein